MTIFYIVSVNVCNDIIRGCYEYNEIRFHGRELGRM